MHFLSVINLRNRMALVVPQLPISNVAHRFRCECGRWCIGATSSFPPTEQHRWWKILTHAMSLLAGKSGTKGKNVFGQTTDSNRQGDHETSCGNGHSLEENDVSQ